MKGKVSTKKDREGPAFKTVRKNAVGDHNQENLLSLINLGKARRKVGVPKSLEMRPKKKIRLREKSGVVERCATIVEIKGGIVYTTIKHVKRQSRSY